MLCVPVFVFTYGSSALYSAHVVVYRSDCHYLPYSMHFYEFMPILSRENGTKHENTRSPKMAADSYSRHKALILSGEPLPLPDKFSLEYVARQHKYFSKNPNIYLTKYTSHREKEAKTPQGEFSLTCLSL